MHFVWPEALWTLLVLPLLWAGYIWMLKRQRVQALRFPSLMLLRPALQGQLAWRRHVPPLMLWLALACKASGLGDDMCHRCCCGWLWPAVWWPWPGRLRALPYPQIT